MIVKKNILSTLGNLNSLYHGATTVVEATYYSKLAIIEACGWIEVSMDSIVESYANRKLRSVVFQDIFRSVKKNNYGFQYKNNFRKMMYSTIGLREMEKIEIKLNRHGSIDVLDAQLESLLTDRNDASHTFIGTTTSYPAPSATKATLLVIYPILRDIDREVRNL